MHNTVKVPKLSRNKWLAFKIGDDEKLALRLEAERRGLSVSDVVRQYIRSLDTFVIGAT